ncbi:MAG: PstS family phosphate ABC transporter substrate-binding protein [Planctomycetes bacterium]|nr:PstS family phosphate ABC transporter substrate-binding protein [Planctomycetota bacterium]
MRQPNTRFLYAAAAIIAMGLLAAAGCNTEPDVGGLRGDITIDGSSTVAPISRAAAGAFGKEFPGVKVTVAISGTGGGFKRFVTGETDISDASRPIKKDEFESAKAGGVRFIELPVAYDGLTIVVHPENDWVEQLTVDQLRQIYREDSAARKWSDLDPSWPGEEIHVYAPGHQSGTYDYFREVMAVGDEKPEDVVMRKEMSTNEDDNVLVTGVSRDKNAIGFFGASYYFNNKDKVKAAKIINPETGEAVAPTPEAVENGAYAPFSRPLFIYVNVDSLKRPEMKRFVDFYLEHARKLAEDVDYVGLSEELYGRATEHFEQRLTGTHYLTEDGEKRTGGLPEIYQEENLRDGE